VFSVCCAKVDMSLLYFLLHICVFYILFVMIAMFDIHTVAYRQKPGNPSQSGCPLLDNGYALRSGFIGNAYKSTQQPTSEYWKHIRGSFPRQQESTDKFPAQQIGRFMTTNYTGLQPNNCIGFFYCFL
jgi:hypothetical protein